MLKRRHFLAVCLLATCAAAVPAILAQSGELLVDDQGWALATTNAMDGTMEVLTDGGSHPPIYEINVLRPGNGVYDLHLEKPVPADVLAANKPFVLRFKARAGRPRKIRTALQDAQAEPWAHEVALTKDWQEFRLPVKTDSIPKSPAVMAFQVGGTSGEVIITDIKLERS
ncbi:hypothetical protein [Armatimonas sp.]|uniref:hypothetical protein n=1 Tax=Armatimonas sp. TaxID=1872638 RepID=UPI0037521622